MLRRVFVQAAPALQAVWSIEHVAPLRSGQNPPKPGGWPCSARPLTHSTRLLLMDRSSTSTSMVELGGSSAWGRGCRDGGESFGVGWLQPGVRL